MRFGTLYQVCVTIYLHSFKKYVLQNLHSPGIGFSHIQSIHERLTPNEKRNGNCVQYFDKVSNKIRILKLY